MLMEREIREVAHEINKWFEIILKQPHRGDAFSQKKLVSSVFYSE
jgi:hypothetical protein